MVRMSGAAALPVHLWQNVLPVFTQSDDISLGQGCNGINGNTITETTLKATMELCTRDASTCSFGLIGSYVDAVRTCACRGQDAGMPTSGEIPLRTPSDTTAPDAEEMFHCLLQLVDIHPDDPHRSHLSIDDFCGIVSFLHARVLPLVPQVLHSQSVMGSVMGVHMNERAITARVERCPYFNPRRGGTADLEDFDQIEVSEGIWKMADEEFNRTGDFTVRCLPGCWPGAGAP